MSYPVLYILMRTDLASLNSGKAMAQAVHAGNAIETHFEIQNQLALNSGEKAELSKAETLSVAYREWKNQTTQGFGTTIVLGGSMSLINPDIKRLQKFGYLAGIVHDPTYPLVDGSVTHLIPLDTCAYVFVPNKDDPTIRMALSDYELHP
jgi:hypothetical protein